MKSKNNYVTKDELAESPEYPFLFSIVMAVYNVELFLEEAVDSVIEQDIGFENVQLILVDDGSTDNSGMICDEYAGKYPNNIMAIHKENGGVSSARNEGLKFATGRYLNFMDSDDRFSSNVLSAVYNFFIQYEDETDVVTIPLEFFDARDGEHWQNDKFLQGSRVINLLIEYTATDMFVNASFFKSDRKDDICFDGRLATGEDMKVILTVLYPKLTLGVVDSTKYLYRRRSQGDESLIQSSKKKRDWYFNFFSFLLDWAHDFYLRKIGYFPDFVQYTLLCDIQWRFKEVYDPKLILNKDETEEYLKLLYNSMKLFDDKYILEQKLLWDEHKIFMLSKKYGKAPSLYPYNNDALVHFGATNITFLSQAFTKLDFIRIEESQLIIEGFTKVFACTEEEPIQVYFEVNGKLQECEYVNRNVNEYRFNELLFRGIAFRFVLPISQTVESYILKIFCSFRNIMVQKKHIQFGKFCPIGNEYKKAYYYQEQRVLTFWKGTFYFQRCGKKGRILREYALLKELWSMHKISDKKAFVARLAYRAIKPFIHKPILLISDRVNKADDNGEAFFEYVLSHHKKEVHAYFVLDKNSGDWPRLCHKGKTVNYFSFKHKMLFLLCSYNISSHADEFVRNPFVEFFTPYRDITADIKYIFLQHGVIKDDLSDWLDKYKKNITGFITTALPEYNSIVNGNYHYLPNEIWLTGLPRYDKLYSDNKRYITIMPTWRKYLMTTSSEQPGVWNFTDSFAESGFYNFYNFLLNDSRLLNAASQYGYIIQFKPHPTMALSQELFGQSKGVKFLSLDTEYRKVFAESDLVITDYSSVAFDFAYLRKPILYCQFDKDDFFKGEHVYTKGYFDYERDGFGEVEYDLESTVDRIIEYMQNGCQLKEKYRERIDYFFPFHDQNNSQRVYNAIMSLKK